MGVLLVAGPAGAATRTRVSDVLTWAPPGYPDYTGFQTVVNNSATPFFDFGDVPTILRTTVATTQKFSIRSNTHVVMDQGWEHTVSASGVNREFCAVLPSSTGTPQDGRIVHIEGALVGGYYNRGDVHIDDPTVIVQLQNCRWTQGAWVDDAIEPGRQHPDTFQPYGGAKEVRMDMCTADIVYQGFIIGWDEGAGGGDTGPVTIKRTNFEWNADYASYEIGELGDPLAKHPNYFVHCSRYFDTQHDPDALITLDRFSFRSHQQELSVVTNGTSTANLGRAAPYDGWGYDVTSEGGRLALDFARSTARWSGKLYEGAPFTGDGADWCPVGVPGLGYTSPGYQG